MRLGQDTSNSSFHFISEDRHSRLATVTSQASERGPPSTVPFSCYTFDIEIADQADFKYIWIDTCCIDKTSSAELSEAINSMYAWYENAVVCYAYLEDVEVYMSEGGMPVDVGNSRWFTPRLDTSRADRSEIC